MSPTVDHTAAGSAAGTQPGGATAVPFHPAGTSDLAQHSATDHTGGAATPPTEPLPAFTQPGIARDDRASAHQNATGELRDLQGSDRTPGLPDASSDLQSPLETDATASGGGGRLPREAGGIPPADRPALLLSIHEHKSFPHAQPQTWGEQDDTSNAAADHERRLGRYGLARLDAQRVLAHIRQTFTGDTLRDEQWRHRAAQLHHCGNLLVFQKGEERTRLVAGRFCQQDKLCRICALRRSGRAVRLFHQRFNVVLAQLRERHGSAVRPVMTTLTVRNSDDLAERVETLKTGMKRLQQRRKNADDASCMSHVYGGASSIEVKRGERSGLWHPHSHSLWFVGPGFETGPLVREWAEVTDGSYRVDVRDIYHPEDPVQDLLEVFKYALKLGDLDPADQVHAFESLFRRRLVNSFGCLYGVPIEPDTLTDDEPLDEPYVTLIYRWLYGTPFYELAK